MTEESNPTLSVLVLNYNYAEYLPECLDSILAQTYEDFEVIVLDDASNDESLAAIDRYLADKRVRLVRHETNQGYARSLAEGTGELSRGKYLTVISADDFAVDANAFADQMQQLGAEPSSVACITAYTKVGPDAERSIRHLRHRHRCIGQGTD